MVVGEDGRLWLSTASHRRCDAIEEAEWETCTWANKPKRFRTVKVRVEPEADDA